MIRLPKSASRPASKRTDFGHSHDRGRSNTWVLVATYPVIRLIRSYGTLWFEIDDNMLATRKEMLELDEGVYSLNELLELFERRHAEGQSTP
jgi:hypothetical protein